MTPNKRTIMILQRDLTPEEHDRFMKSTKGEPITSFKVYETNMTNEKEIREQILNTMEKLDMVYRFVDDYENVDEQDKARYKILESLLHSHTKEVVDAIKNQSSAVLTNLGSMDGKLYAQIEIKDGSKESFIVTKDFLDSIASLEDNNNEKETQIYTETVE